jgi:hypothetical protein
VVLYTYKKGTKEQHMIYFWLGHSSSKDEIGEITVLILSYPVLPSPLLCPLQYYAAFHSYWPCSMLSHSI